MDMFTNVNTIKEEMAQIEYNLLCMLEVNIRNGIFVENGAPIHIDGKVINYPKVEMEGPDRYSINYDPFNNRKIAHYLFNRYAVLIQRDDPSISIMSFSIFKYLNNPNYLHAVCRFSNGKEIFSRPFTNEALCWIDLIFIMENDVQSSLHEIDDFINVERMLQQKEREAIKNGRRTK